MTRCSLRLACFVLSTILLTFVGRFANYRLIHAGLLRLELGETTFTPDISLATFHTSADSWEPMLKALHQLEDRPERSVYQVLFFDTHTKFQYPLSSLLPLWALQKLGLSDSGIRTFLLIASWLALCVIAGISVKIGISLFRKRQFSEPPNTFNEAVIAGVIVVGCFLFFPLMRGYELGQVQTFLSLGFAIAFDCWILEKEQVSGAILGAMALIKPQSVIFLLWMLLRKRKSASLAFLTSSVAGLLASLMVFGWNQNVEYLRVLQVIGRLGEGYFPNQSMNGLLNRLLFNGNNAHWEIHSFAPFHPVVYAGTLISSLVLLGLALFYRRNSNRSRATDFACIALVATMASPIAWEHHYGLLFPIFIWLIFSPETERDRPWRTVAIGIAYVLASTCLNTTLVFASMPVANILQSYVFIAGLIVLGLLLTVQPVAAPLRLRIPLTVSFSNSVERS
jgi:alpha-1,2-mannosyltransferase